MNPQAPKDPSGAPFMHPHDHAIRVKAAIGEFLKSRTAGEPVAKQLVAGDWAYCGKNSDANFPKIDFAWNWWPMADGTFDHLEEMCKTAGFRAPRKL